MQTKGEAITIQNVKDGAVLDALSIEMQRVLKNILDPNTDKGAKRKLKLELIFSYNEENNTLSIVHKIGSTLSSIKPIQVLALIGKDIRGNVEASEILTQAGLFDKGTGKVIAISKED